MATVACWGCATGVTATPPALTLASGYAAGDLLGVCWQCGVVGCSQHASRDASSGKWVCYPSVAVALSASAGLDDPPEAAQRFRDVADYEARFPALADASGSARERWQERAKQLQQLAASSIERPVDADLLVAAVATADHLVPPDLAKRIVGIHAMDGSLYVTAVIPGQLGRLLGQALADA